MYEVRQKCRNIEGEFCRGSWAVSSLCPWDRQVGCLVQRHSYLEKFE